MVAMIHIESYADIERTRRLFLELSSCLEFNLLFQDVRHVLEDMPSEYLPPHGSLYLADIGMHVVGCSAVRRVDEHTCELTRLFVSPGFRRRGVGTRLMTTSMEESIRLGYSKMQLKTLPYMKPARALYAKLGFTAYCPAEPIWDIKEMHLQRHLLTAH